MLDVLIDTLLDGFKILPFLFIAFYMIEFFEKRFLVQSKKMVKKAGRFGPFLGGLLGCFPQCGFSVMATNLYVTRIITLGTLISIYLSTSDEMLPILIAHGSSFDNIFKILLTKLLFGIFFGFIIDLFYKGSFEDSIHDLCEHDHCCCEEKGIIFSSVKHTLHTLIFVIGVSFLLNFVMYYGGDKYLRSIFQGNGLLSLFLASLIGLIPNCGASIIITELYLNEVISFSSVIAGLLTGSGVSLLILFKINKDLKENINILLLLYFIGVFSGFVIELISYLV